ncbi:hypothetical protein BASA81_018510 [Batrachochytrium salamandrivorans]|nr:hypothetical protein BASA81_018510 [Batrachochytrium salamandrivorans]
MVGFQSKNEGYFGESTGAGIRDQASCSGKWTKSEIKDHLVHCESPVSLAAAMDQAIRIDNRIFERRQEQQYNPRHSDETNLQSPVPRSHSQQYQQRFVDNYIDLSKSNLLLDHCNSRPTTSEPDDMDIDFARRGPLTSSERQQRFIKDFACLRSVRTPQSYLSSVQLSLQTPTPSPSH